MKFDLTTRSGELIVCENPRCIYAMVPKAGCSNWIMLLRRLQGFKDHNEPRLIYDRRSNGLTYTTYENALNTLDLDRYFKFSFVRHPYTRLIASYRNKFDATYSPTSSFWQRVADTMLRTIGEPADTALTFSRFVRFVETQAPDEMNEHWAPQSLLLALDRFPFDFIGNLESFKPDYARVSRELGIEIPFPSQKDVRFPSTGANALAQRWLSPQIRAILRNIYESDLEAFGYDADAPPARLAS